MLRFHRTTYSVAATRFHTTWWQLGDRILRQRTRTA